MLWCPLLSQIYCSYFFTHVLSTHQHVFTSSPRSLRWVLQTDRECEGREEELREWIDPKRRGVKLGLRSQIASRALPQMTDSYKRIRAHTFKIYSMHTQTLCTQRITRGRFHFQLCKHFWSRATLRGVKWNWLLSEKTIEAKTALTVAC